MDKPSVLLGPGKHVHVDFVSYFKRLVGSFWLPLQHFTFWTWLFLCLPPHTLTHSYTPHSHTFTLSLQSSCSCPHSSCFKGILRELTQPASFPGTSPAIVFFFHPSFHRSICRSIHFVLCVHYYFSVCPLIWVLCWVVGWKAEQNKPGSLFSQSSQPSTGADSKHSYTSGHLITIVINAEKKDVSLLITQWTTSFIMNVPHQLVLMMLYFAYIIKWNLLGNFISQVFPEEPTDLIGFTASQESQRAQQ